MKKTQWQFTHRPDNLADIKRILREAREDGLTLVEVKGGPKELRGVYLDAQFIEQHKEHWPKTPPLASKLPTNSAYDGWTGNYIMFAGEAKEAHEQFCKSLEAAQAKPREYPPTVSVRAAGPDVAKTAQWLPKPGEWFKVSGYRPEFSVFSFHNNLSEGDRKHDGRAFKCISVDDPKKCDVSHDVIRRYGNCIICEDPTSPTGDRVFRTKEWKTIEPWPLAQVQQEPRYIPAPDDKKVEEQTPYIPQTGDKFTVAGKKGREWTTFIWAQTQPHQDVLECTARTESMLHFNYPNGEKSQLTTDAYEFKKVEEQTPYIPQPGDKFTAKGIHEGAFSETRDRPHKDVFECLNIGIGTISARHPHNAIVTMTKRYYEFRKVPS